MHIFKPFICVPLLMFVFSLACLAEDANDMREKGIAALKESLANPRAIVEAARSFVKASELYVTAGNEEKAIEMNSFLYWCKKKMAMEDIDAFVKGGEASVSNKLDAIEKLAPKADEAQTYLDRAEQFANKNPAEHLLIAIRFYEVADRFKGSDSGMKALDRSLKEQLQDKSTGAKSALPPTAIRVPDTAPATVGSRPIPPGEDIKQAEKLIKDILKDEYAKTDAPGQLALAAKLMQQADENKGDPASEYVLLHEARDHAVTGGDAAVATGAQKRLRDGFKIDFAAMLIDLRKLEATSKSADAAAALATLLSLGADDALAVDNFDQAVRYNSRAEDLIPLIKNAPLKDHLKSEVARVLALKQASAGALTAAKTLATKPDDPEANLTTGKFALQKGEFEKAVALLAKGSDKLLASLAKRELTPAAEALEQAKIGDDWFDLAAKESNTYVKKSMQERAGVWYGNALPALKGLAKLKVETRMKTLQAISKSNAASGESTKQTEAPRTGAKVLIDEKMGYTIQEFSPGISSHNNMNRPFKEIPPDFSKLQFTQLVAYSSLPVNAKVLRAGKVYIAPFHNESPPPGFTREPISISNNTDSFDVWSCDCPSGFTFIYPSQIMIIAAEIEKSGAGKAEHIGSAPKALTVAPVAGNKNEVMIDLGGGVKIEFIPITSGTFLMGSPPSEHGRSGDEMLHTVRITKSFYTSKFLVTQEQYSALTNENPSGREHGSKRPVEMVTWIKADKYCDMASVATGRKIRLPTEAEWEYACRAGTKTRYNVGESAEDLKRAGWYRENAEDTTHDVGGKAPNAWGLYDMHGNLWEWCLDGKMDYAQEAQTDPRGSTTSSDRVIRGGSLDNDHHDCRSARRNQFPINGAQSNIGFRVVMELQAESDIKKPVESKPSFSAKESANLFSLVDLKKDTVSGVWSVTPTGLRAAESDWTKLQLPYHPPEDYDVKFEFTRLTKHNSDVGLMIKVGSQQALVSLCGFGNRIAGLHMMDGKLADDNPSRAETALENNRRYSVLVEVRKSGVRASIDGKLLFDVKTEGATLELRNEWRLKDSDAIGVGCHECDVIFHSLTITEPNVKGEFLRR